MRYLFDISKCVYVTNYVWIDSEECGAKTLFNIHHFL